MWLVNWWNALSTAGHRLLLVAGTVGVLGGAVTASVGAWPLIEFAVPAHRGFVLEKVGGVQATTNELLIWKFEDSRARLKSESDGWNIQMRKENDSQTRALIEQRVQQLGVEQQQIEDRIRKLRGQ